MSRVKTGRGKGGGKCCFSCLIISIIVLVLFVGGLFLGANFAFNKYVSPHIGGVTLTEALSLLRGLYSADRSTIVTEEFVEGDLNTFYENLNLALFQQPYTEQENLAINQEEYDNLPAARREAMSDDERDAFLARQNYRINIKTILDAVNFGDTVSDGQMDDQIPLSVVAAAEDEDPMTQLLKQLLFDFSVLSTYNEDDETDALNLPFTTLTITGKQVAAVVNEIVGIMLTGENSPLDEVEPLKNIDNITDYIKVPQVKINYTKALEDCDTVEEYENSVQFSITVEVKLGEIVNLAIDQFAGEISQIPPVAINLVRRIIPKNLFLTVGAYPLDSEGEAFVVINNFSDKQIATMNTILNAVLGDSFAADGEGGGEEEPSSSTSTVFKDINSRITEVFTKIKDQNIAFDFVAVGEVAGMQLKHVEMLLSMMNLIDPDDPYNLNEPGVINSVTPHMFLSAMKCLTVSYDEDDPDYSDVAKNYTDADLTAFLTTFESRYGIVAGYLSSPDVSILDPSTLQNLPNHISLADNIDYELTPQQMRVDLQDIALAALLADALQSGFLGGGGGDETATAEDDEGGLNFVSLLNFNQVAISKSVDDVVLTNYIFNEGTPEEYTVAELTKSVYELKLVLSLSLSDLFSSMEGEQSEIIETVFSSLSSIYISAAIFIEELSDNDIVYQRTVGGVVYPAAFRINKFSYDNTDKVFNTISLMMQKIGGNENSGEDSPFDMTTLTTQVEEMLQNMFSMLEDNLKATIRMDENKLILPSIYEVISGMVNDKATVPEDEMDADEVHLVFKGIYDSGIEVIDFGATPSPEAIHVLEMYDEGVADAFLASLSNKYYMKEQINTAALFNSEEINNMFSASSLNFTGVDGLYSDSTELDRLSVPMTGDALAALLVQSGQLDQLSQEGGDGMLKKLTIVNAVLRADGTSLYIDFELIAHLKEDAPPAAAAEEGDGEGGMNIDGFLPDRLYITASVLVFADAYTPEVPRFSTEVAVNKMEDESNNNLFKLIRVLSGQDTFDTAEITGEVKEAIEAAFTNIEENINMTYYVELTIVDAEFNAVKETLNDTYGVDTATDADTINTIMLADIFNTLNKLSNKEDPLYVPSTLDDGDLRARLQEFGREPEKEFDLTNTTGIMYLDNMFAIGDSDDFIDDFNRYYYIDQNNRMTADGLLANDGFFATSASSADSFNFKSTEFLGYPGLYLDETPYDENDFAVRMSDKALAELIYSGSGEIDPVTGLRSNQIALGEGGDYAIIIQAKIYTDGLVNVLMISMQVFISEPAPAPGEEPAEILPEYLFVTILVDMDLIMTNPDSVTGNDLTLFVNGMTEEETQDFFDRLNKLSSAMGFDMAGFNENDLKDNAANAIKNGFTELSKIEGVDYGEDAEGGYLRLPDVFTYLVNHCEMVEPSTEATTGAQLCSRMREFGRTPDKDGDEISEVMYYTSVDIVEFDVGATFDNTDADDFLVTFNRNFYFAESKQMSTTDLFSGTFTIGGDTFNFNDSFDVGGITYDGLYVDSRPYNELEIRLTDAQLGSLIKQKEDGFTVGGGGGGAPDVAEIVQFGIIFDAVSGHHMLKTIILYSPSTQGDSMPDYLFITSYTNLDEVDGFGEKTYATYILVNDLNEEETARFFDNMNALQAKLGISSNVQKDTIESSISDKFREVFDDQLGSIGNLEWNEGYIKLPNMFEYIVTGENINEGAGMFDYVVDALGNKIEDASDPSGTGFETTSTSPESLMLRLRGFGAKLDEQQDISAEDSVTTYNDNQYEIGDDSYFYEMLEFYYYLNSTPSASDIYNGTLFTTIDNTSFNFTGDDVNYSDPEPNYYGLYYYSGSQYKARLSDRALAAILATQGDDPSTTGMTVAIESLKMYIDGGNLVFELTSKATFGATAGDAVPEYVYITSFTTRTADGLGGWDYDTQIVTNTFVVSTGNTLNLSYNLTQMGSYGVDFDAFDTDAICDNISDMVKSALESLSEGLNISYKTYEDDPVVTVVGEEGVGYIEFKSMYGIIADMTLDEDSDETTANTMQSMIVKLHDPDIYASLITHPKNSDIGTGTDYVNNFPVKQSGYVLDTYFAHMIGSISEDGVDVEPEQALFASTASEATVRDAWETRFDNASEEGFTFAIGEDYIIVTGIIEMNAFATGNASLLPAEIYASLIMNADEGSAFDPILMFNEMDADEMELFFNIATSDTANLSTLTTNLKTRVVDTMDEVNALFVPLFGFDPDGTIFHPSDATYPDCFGYMEIYKNY